MPNFDVFSLLEIRKRKSRSHGIRKKGNGKRKKRAVKRSNTSLKDLSKVLEDHGRHSMLSFLSSLPISVLRILDTEANKFYDRSHQDQDQDSLLVKRRNDNHSPGPVIRELVPSSHQRSELSNTILCIFSGWDQRIGEGIPIPDSLGEEATFVNICIGNGSLKCHRVLIPTTPSFGDKVICWYTGFTFKTFI